MKQEWQFKSGDVLYHIEANMIMLVKGTVDRVWTNEYLIEDHDGDEGGCYLRDDIETCAIKIGEL